MQCLSRPQRRLAKNEDGAALIIVLVTLVGLTALAVAGMMVTDTEIRASQNMEASTYAFYAADAGLHEYLGTHKTADTAATYTFAEGTATVLGEKLVNLTSDSSRVLYRIISQGTYVSPAGGQANRTLRVNAIRSSGESPFTFGAGLAAPTGLIKSGGSGLLSGFDTSDSTECAGPNVAGVSVPEIPGYYQTNGDTVPVGNPGIVEHADGLTLLDETGIDWGELLAGNVVPPDYSIPPDAYPFTENDALDPEGWPVIIVDQDLFELNTWKQSGRGLLIVRGDFEPSGSFEWDGVVLIGGRLRTNGGVEFEGAIVAGLNIQLGDTVAETELGNGNLSIQYNNCNIERAFSALAGLSEVPGTWNESM